VTVRCRAWGRVRVRHARLGWVKVRVRFRARARVRVRHARLQRRGQPALEQQVAQVYPAPFRVGDGARPPRITARALVRIQATLIRARVGVRVGVRVRVKDKARCWVRVKGRGVDEGEG